MKLIKPSYTITTPIDGEQILKQIEVAARTCYKSEGRIEHGENGEAISARKLIKGVLLSKGHEAMLEFGGMISVKFTCDRGVSHELVRHRIASFAQESTRYVDYSDEQKNGADIQFILPPWVDEIQLGIHDSKLIAKQFAEIPEEQEFTDKDYNELVFLNAMATAEISYQSLLKRGWKPQEARAVLPNSLKTEINMACNLREWRHFFKLRCSTAAHPQMVQLTKPLLAEFKQQIPIIFDDLIF